MDSIDKLLAEVKAEYSEVEPQTAKKQQPQAESFKQPPAKKEPFIDNLLNQLKTEYEEKEHLEEQQKQQELKAEKLKQEKVKKQQIQVLTNQAKQWLDKLEPLSSEGIWFEQFARNYPSKLEAAIDYLQSMQ